MNGRDLIVYIMQNHLEDEEVLKDGRVMGLVSDMELAVKFHTGVESVRTLMSMTHTPSVKIDNTMYYPAVPKIETGGNNEENS